MVCDKIVIVDVDAALKNNGEILRLIKDKYPSIAQLFHFRKSHQVHFVGAASAQNDIYLAMNDVYAAVGEPFSFSEDDKTLFLKLVEEMTPDKMEAFLRDHCKLFKPGECFARDDKLRHGWRMSGPMYGVCAHSPQRRNELLVSCVLAINRQYNIHLALLVGAASLVQQVTGTPIPQPPTQTWAQESKLTFEELQLKHREQQQRQQGLLAFAPLPAAREPSQPPSWQQEAYTAPPPATTGVHHNQWPSNAPRTGPPHAVAHLPGHQNQSLAKSGWDAAGGVVAVANTSNLGSGKSEKLGDTETANIQAILVGLDIPGGQSEVHQSTASPAITVRASTASAQPQTEPVTSSHTVAQMSTPPHAPKTANDPPHAPLAPLPPLAPLASSSVVTVSSRSEATTQTEGREMAASIAPEIPLGRDSDLIPAEVESDDDESVKSSHRESHNLSNDRLLDIQLANFNAALSSHIRENFKVDAVVGENRVVLRITDEELALRAASGGSKHQQLLDLAEDIVFTQCGSSRLTVQIAHTTPGVKKLLNLKPKKNTKQAPPSVVEKSPIAVVLADYLATTCAKSLRGGETIDVLSVSPLNSLPVVVTFVVNGMTGRELKRRSEKRILPIVRECLTNVFELGEDAQSDGSETWGKLNDKFERGFGVAEWAFTMLAAQYGVFVLKREVDSNNEMESATVGGRVDALDSFCRSVRDFSGT
ncbi:Hypothetical protein, putative [Bodo saltans]|uniref:Uncharacterized protein n=1 Tax=Bodo saltans TaxID=75058 RepID=A0A0S4IVL3_BODSA|nr:Hypothetical protein, putative [Bodo saltans]|eukprot:CUG19912.1 Hypothetical protein, putative [Bodo saltans]